MQIDPNHTSQKGKASDPDQIWRSKTGRAMVGTHDDNTLPNDAQSKEDTQDEDILKGEDDIAPDDGAELLGPDKIGFYTFSHEGQGNPPDLMGTHDDQLLAIQHDLCER